MAVSGSDTLKIFALPSVDKRFPIGYFQGQIAIAGDATAGAATYTFNWSTARPDLFFRLRHVYYTEDQNVSRGVLVRVLTQQLITGTTALVHAHAGTATAIANVPRCALHFNIDGFLFQPNSGTAFSIVVETNNPGATFTGQVGVIGEVWDSQGSRLPGFPGLYDTRHVVFSP